MAGLRNLSFGLLPECNYRPGFATDWALGSRFKQLETERRESRHENLVKRQIGLLEQVMLRLDKLENRRSASVVDSDSEKSAASSETAAG